MKNLILRCEFAWHPDDAADHQVANLLLSIDEAEVTRQYLSRFIEISKHRIDIIRKRQEESRRGDDEK